MLNIVGREHGEKSLLQTENGVQVNDVQRSTEYIPSKRVYMFNSFFIITYSHTK